MIRIEDIVEKVAANHAQADLDLLRRAYLFSAKEHNVAIKHPVSKIAGFRTGAAEDKREAAGRQLL